MNDDKEACSISFPTTTFYAPFIFLLMNFFPPPLPFPLLPLPAPWSEAGSSEEQRPLWAVMKRPVDFLAGPAWPLPGPARPCSLFVPAEAVEWRPWRRPSRPRRDGPGHEGASSRLANILSLFIVCPCCCSSSNAAVLRPRAGRGNRQTHGTKIRKKYRRKSVTDFETTSRCA